MKSFINYFLFLMLILMSSDSCSDNTRGQKKNDIVLENAEFRLTIGNDAHVVSLIHKSTGQECLQKGVRTPFCALTQYRPYENELQLRFPAKPRTFEADSVYKQGDDLIVSFELINIKVTIGFKIEDGYIGFILKKVDYKLPKYGDQLKTIFDEFTILQLPVRNRVNFGEWLNVVWDKNVAVNVLATDQYGMIDAVACDGYHLLRAGGVSEVKNIGVGAVLIVTKTDQLLNHIDLIEQNYNLPRGVMSRLRKEYRYSYYEAVDLTPENIDENIAFAKKGGFRAFQINWNSVVSACGHFPWSSQYPNGMADLQKVIRKIKDAGMIVGAHFWYNKAEINDLYVTPVPDYRLNLSRLFTLATELDKKSNVVEVEENPRGCTLDDNRRILKIGKELIEYTNYTSGRPYRFTGCTRGVLNTHSSQYEQGLKFGLLDVDTWPVWVRFDQRTSIQQEVAERLGKIYNDAGFQFAYFDGAEDVPPPYWFNTSLAQLKVLNCMNPAPMFSEGALKITF